MINLSIRNDLKGVSDMLRQLPARQVAFATSLAINTTAQKVKADLYVEMQRSFVSPTRWTLSSLFIRPSNKRNLSARVWVKDDAFKGIPAAKYLGPEIFGEPRRHKRFERALIAKGLMPSNMYAVPGDACPLDGDGNIPRGFIVQLLAYFEAFGQQGYKANMTNKGKTRFVAQQGRAFFVGRPGNNAPLGIWARYTFAQGSAVKPILIFVKRPAYSKRLKFFEVVERSVAKHFAPEFAKSFERAMATARP